MYVFGAAPPRIMQGRRRPRLLMLEIGGTMALVLAFAMAVYASGALAPTPLATLVVIAALGAVVLFERALRWGLADGLGPANRVTLIRAMLCLPVLALVFHPQAVDEVVRWWLVGIASLVLLLDGVDGWIARRNGCSSAFGARFDMELDALLLLALSVLVWHSGQAGAWVLLIGAMRYVFVAAGWLLPALREPLPEAFRRKVACVIQGVVLVGCLAPLVPPLLATVAAALALMVLLWSFALDTHWLLRPRPKEKE